MTKTPAHTANWLPILTFCLSLFGLLMIYDASSVVALKDFGDQYYYVRNQLIWFLLGSLFFIIASRINYRLYFRYALPIFIVNILLLVAVLIPGIGREIMGGRRWIGVGNHSFQPSESMKLALVIYLSSILCRKRRSIVFLIILTTVAALVMWEPDLGTTMITVLTANLMYFSSEVGIVTFIKNLIPQIVASVTLILIAPYRRHRLMTYLNPSNDDLGKSYHITQAFLAIGSGGLFGRGFGQSRQKFLFLPEATTDSIFAIIAEEFGYIGSLAMIIVFLILIREGLLVAGRSKDDFGRLLATGITAFIGFQVLVNLAAMVSLIPLTGIPLPFISYGGSSLFINMVGMGILYNIHRQSV